MASTFISLPLEGGGGGGTVLLSTIEAINNNTILGNNTGSSHYPVALTLPQSQVLLTPKTRIYRDSTQDIATSSVTTVTWTQVAWDDYSMFNALAPTKLTIPAGFTKAWICLSILWQAIPSGTDCIVLVSLNGTSAYIYDRRTISFGGCSSGTSGWMPVAAGDYLEASVYQSSGGTATIGSAAETFLTYLSVELGN